MPWRTRPRPSSLQEQLEIFSTQSNMLEVISHVDIDIVPVWPHIDYTVSKSLFDDKIKVSSPLPALTDCSNVPHLSSRFVCCYFTINIVFNLANTNYIEQWAWSMPICTMSDVQCLRRDFNDIVKQGLQVVSMSMCASLGINSSSLLLTTMHCQSSFQHWSICRCFGFFSDGLKHL